jgi:steroid delta-isomerase-like uncharacterized protein
LFPNLAKEDEMANPKPGEMAIPKPTELPPIAASCRFSLIPDKGDPIDEHFAPDFVSHGPLSGPLMGFSQGFASEAMKVMSASDAMRVTADRTGRKQWATATVKAFPDYNVTVEDEISQGDKVVTRWTARGTHQGEFLGIAPTGKQVTVTGITISRHNGGKIVESWTEWDTQSLMQQLGGYPSIGGRRELAGGVNLNITINRV